MPFASISNSRRPTWSGGRPAVLFHQLESAAPRCCSRPTMTLEVGGRGLRALGDDLVLFVELGFRIVLAGRWPSTQIAPSSGSRSPPGYIRARLLRQCRRPRGLLVGTSGPWTGQLLAARQCYSMSPCQKLLGPLLTKNRRRRSCSHTGSDPGRQIGLDHHGDDSTDGRWVSHDHMTCPPRAPSAPAAGRGTRLLAAVIINRASSSMNHTICGKTRRNRVLDPVDRLAGVALYRSAPPRSCEPVALESRTLA